MSAPRARLATVRDEPRYRYLVMALGGILGLALATVHWLGIVLGGAVVGLAATRFRYALGAGVVYGLVVGAAFAAWLALGGALGGALDTGAVFGIGVGIAVVGATLGSLARGIV